MPGAQKNNHQNKERRNDGRKKRWNGKNRKGKNIEIQVNEMRSSLSLNQNKRRIT